jgi:hypothetical protein
MSHEKNRALLEALHKCAEECSHCTAACLEEEDVKMLARCIRLNMDCAEICSLAISFVSRGSEHAQHLLDECADICFACAEECRKHQHMEHCKRCAEVCTACAEACQGRVVV